LPAQVPAPAADRVPRRAAATAQQREADVLHLVEVEQPLDADDQREGAGQEAPPEDARVVRQRRLGGRQPTQRGREEEEGAGGLPPRGEKGGAGAGTGRPAGNSGTPPGGRTSGSAGGWSAGGSAAGAWAGPGPWSRPYFLRKWYRAMRDTRTPKVASR